MCDARLCSISLTRSGFQRTQISVLITDVTRISSVESGINLETSNVKFLHCHMHVCGRALTHTHAHTHARARVCGVRVSNTNNLPQPFSCSRLAEDAIWNMGSNSETCHIRDENRSHFLTKSMMGPIFILLWCP